MAVINHNACTCCLLSLDAKFSHISPLAVFSDSLRNSIYPRSLSSDTCCLDAKLSHHFQPELQKLQEKLAALGLKDPWIRNEVWRFDRGIQPTVWQNWKYLLGRSAEKAKLFMSNKNLLAVRVHFLKCLILCEYSRINGSE